MAHQDRVNIAVFIDFDNVEIGVKSTLGEHFDIGTVLEAIKERGEVVTKIAYADWTRAGEYSRALTQHAIRLVQRNLTPGGDKNGADINLALDALEMAFTHPHINAYVIVGGDSDFLSLVEKLKQYDKKVFVVGGRAFTSIILQRNCHEFIAYENLVRKPSALRTGSGSRPPAPAAAAAPITQAFPIVRRALKVLADREVSPQTGLLKSTLLQLDSTFSERNYGASSFLDFAEKLSQAGLVALKHSGRSVMVELNPGFTEEGGVPPARAEGEGGEAVIVEGQSTPVATEVPWRSSEEPTARPAEPAGPRLGDQADGIKVAGQLLAGATNARWPMYLRNAKQILRAGNFDERKYGFGGLIELLKGCQRDGLVRVERDRRGGLRVFQGPQLPRTATPSVAAPSSSSQILDVENEPEVPSLAAIIVQEFIETESAGVADTETDADPNDMQPRSIVDTTAEMLGRAMKGRRPVRRSSAGNGEEASAPRAARGTRKTTRRPAARGKKKDAE